MIYIVIFLVSPKVVVPVQVVRLVDRPVVLSCSATGTPPINIAIITNSTILVNVTDTARIRITEEGNYTCRATSKYGTDEKVFKVINGENTQIIDFSFFKTARNLSELSDIHCTVCATILGQILLHPFSDICYFTFPIGQTKKCDQLVLQDDIPNDGIVR